MRTPILLQFIFFLSGSSRMYKVVILIIATITNSDLNRPCFAWHPYGKLGLFKTELVII